MNNCTNNKPIKETVKIKQQKFDYALWYDLPVKASYHSSENSMTGCL